MSKLELNGQDGALQLQVFGFEFLELQGGAAPPVEDPLSMPTAAMKDTASVMVSWIPANRPKQRQRTKEVADWVLSRPTRPEDS
jgi:hypothetical protein